MVKLIIQLQHLCLKQSTHAIMIVVISVVTSQDTVLQMEPGLETCLSVQVTTYYTFAMHVLMHIICISLSLSLSLCLSDITCESPPSVANGSILISSTSNGTLVATYECDEGFISVGGDCERTCQCNGTWSGSEVSCIMGGKSCN